MVITRDGEERERSLLEKGGEGGRGDGSIWMLVFCTAVAVSGSCVFGAAVSRYLLLHLSLFCIHQSPRKKAVISGPSPWGYGLD